MTYAPTADFLAEVSKGRVPGHSLIHKFGRNTAVGTTFVPLSLGGIYRTPQAASATTLRIKSGGNSNDAAGGSGAREVTLIGTDESGDEVSEAIATNGTSASSATTTTFMRLHRAFVSASGTYATQSAGSHAATITIENSAGTQDWATISATNFPRGQSEIGAYTIPNGFTGFLLGAEYAADSSKTTQVLLFRRPNILESAAPYSAMRLLLDDRTEGGRKIRYEPGAPLRIDGPADIGFMAKVDAGTATVDCNFTLLVVADSYVN